jgi:uroporphyrinogen III methyltransferase/synthase
VAESVVEALARQKVAKSRILLPRAEGARRELVRGLRALGARVDELPLYVAAPPAAPEPEALRRLRAGEVDVVTFASSSAVKNLLKLLEGDTAPLKGPLIACIGPVTARTAREAGLEVGVESREHTIPGLVAALREHYGVKVRAGRSGVSDV